MRLFLHPFEPYEWIKYFNSFGRLAAKGGNYCRTSHHQATPHVVYHPGYGVVCADCRVEKLGPFYKSPAPVPNSFYDRWDI